MKIIDIHTHVFPDALAERAIPALEKEANVKAKLDGKLSSLLRSMDEAGIDKSVVCSIATKAEQFAPILKWSKSIETDRIIAFPSVHPADPEAVRKVDQIHAEGFRGIKLHPYYQEFYLDEESILPLYQRIEECGLVFLCHTGFDIAFERVRRCDPARIARVIELFPRLKFVSTHFGAWEDWTESRACLMGKPVYMDISMSFDYMGDERACDFLTNHPKEYLVFGSDSPWSGQKETIDKLRSLHLDRDREESILSANARRLLALR